MSGARTDKVQPARREHPWERARRLAFARWETEVRRAAYGRPLPDVLGFADAIEPPLHWSDPAETRRLFAFSALPAGSTPTYLAAVPAGQRRPAEGRLVRLSHPVKRVLPAADAVYGELLIEAQAGVAPASWEEILEGVSPRGAARVVPQLSELWNVPALVIETLLLPLVGSLPWHGRSAGLDLHIEVEGWSLARHRSFLSGVLDLAPQWVRGAHSSSTFDAHEVELVSGARVRRRSLGSARPFTIQLRSISAPPTARPSAEAPPRSVITYGNALASEFEAVLAAGQATVLLTAQDAGPFPAAPVEPPEALRAAVWGLHWWTPEPPDAPDWHRWLRNEEPRLREALDAMPRPPSGGRTAPWSMMADRREFRDRLAQMAFARARLRGATEVAEADLTRTVDSVLRATQQATVWAGVGRGPLSRALDRTEGGRTTRLRRTLEALLEGRTEGLTVDETVAALRTHGPVATAWDVENQLERLRIRGLVFQDGSGRYRPV
ncbi:MAG: hypothetical protein WA688_01720 [Thermoplasmata archaeon]